LGIGARGKHGRLPPGMGRKPFRPPNLGGVVDRGGLGAMGKPEAFRKYGRYTGML